MKNTFIIIIILLMLCSCSSEMPRNDVPAQYAHVLRTENYTNTSLIDSMCMDLKLVMENHKVPYGAVIVADCQTGRILGIAEYSERGYFLGEYINKHIVCSSLFKIVTLSAAIGKGLYKPHSRIKYYGSMYSELENYINLRNKEKYMYTSVGYAMAKSNNPAFAEIGLVLGKENIDNYAKKLLFNNKELHGMKTGYIEYYSTEGDIARIASGLDYSYTTVFHQLMIAMMLGNGGELVIPQISISDRRVKRRLLSKTTVDYVLEAMKDTPVKGTSSSIFKDHKSIAERTYAKTGSLYGNNPLGFYNWFSGIYRGNKSNYAIVCVIVNDPIWEIKASYMGLKAIQFIRKYADN